MPSKCLANEWKLNKWLWIPFSLPLMFQWPWLSSIPNLPKHRLVPISYLNLSTPILSLEPLEEASLSLFSSLLHSKGHICLPGLWSVFLRILHLIQFKAPNLLWFLTHGYLHNGEKNPTSSLTSPIIQSYKTDRSTTSTFRSHLSNSPSGPSEAALSSPEMRSWNSPHTAHFSP